MEAPSTIAEKVNSNDENTGGKILKPCPPPLYFSEFHARARARLEEIGIPWDLINKAREKRAKKLASGDNQTEG